MNEKIDALLHRIEEFKPKAAAEVEELRIKLLGKKGEISALMDEFKSVAPELKRELGQRLNLLKNRALERINTLKEELESSAQGEASAIGDMSRPGSAEPLASR
ncbi:MAG: phenylalanine--tRNA ligase subunit alpha, partial [Rikenellaceae bacterium]